MQSTASGSMQSTASGAAEPLGRHSSPGTSTARRAHALGSRALVGGLLVTVAAIGTFVLASGSASDPTVAVVVASRDLSPGTRLTPADMELLRVPADPHLMTSTASSKDVVAGATTLGPLRKGELIQAGGVMFKPADGALPEVSFSVPLSRALGGDLRSGETIDILTSSRNAAGGSARTAVAGARVLKVGGGGSQSLGRSGEVTITVAVASRGEAAALAGAVDDGNLTLVRTTGLPQSER